MPGAGGSVEWHRGLVVSCRAIQRMLEDPLADFILGRELAPDFGQLDEHQVAERFLRMVGDADRQRAVVLRANPLVRFGVFEVFGVAHGALRIRIRG